MPKPTITDGKGKPRKIKYLSVSTRDFHTIHDLEMMLEQLHESLKEAVDKKDAVRVQAFAYNIIHTMREIEKIKAERAKTALQFRVRDIVTFTAQGGMTPEEALEKLKKLV